VGKPRMSMVATMARLYRFVKQPDKQDPNKTHLSFGSIVLW
jgi:hypothetical protein